MDRDADGTSRAEGKEERLRRASALHDAVLGKHALVRETRSVRSPAEGETMILGLAPGTREALGGLDLHKRRYGIPHVTRGTLRKMGCRDLGAVATASVKRCVEWLGYAETEGLRARLEAIVVEVEAGHPEPGVARMVTDLDDETRGWLLSRPVEDVAGRGIPARVAAGLRSAGHESLGALATEEVDAIEDVHGIGRATVDGLRKRLADIVSEGKDAPSRRKRRVMSADDAEWDEAAP